MPENETPSDLGKLFEKVVDSPTASRDEALDALQKENERIRDKSRDERFCWILVTIILFDILLLEKSSNWALPIVVGAFELMLVIVLALKLGLQEINLFVNRVLDAWGQSK